MSGITPVEGRGGRTGVEFGKGRKLDTAVPMNELGGDAQPSDAPPADAPAADTGPTADAVTSANLVNQP